MNYEQYIEHEVFIVRLDKEMLKRYSGYDVDTDGEEYFQAHPRAKKPPFDKLWKKKRLGMLPSTNTFIDCNDRITQNQMKQELGAYTTFCLKAQQIPGAYLQKCLVLVVQHKESRTNSDNDNTFVKSSLDALTKWQMWEDDNYKHVKLFASTSVYDKADPHTDLIIFPIYEDEEGYSYDDVMLYLAKYLMYLENKYKEN